MSSITAALLVGGLGAAGELGAAAIGASSNKGMPQTSYKYYQGPDYQQGQTLTNDWVNQLTADQNSPNFGAISPDWNDIWQQTQQQVQNYFGGTALEPGVNDAIKGSFAQRGMSGDPAEAFTLAGSNAQEAQDIGNLSAQQNIAQQNFANEGKTQWLQSLQAAQNQIANTAIGGSSSLTTAPTPTQQIANAFGTGISSAASGAEQVLGSQNQNAYLNNLLYPNPTSFDGINIPSAKSSLTL